MDLTDDHGNTVPDDSAGDFKSWGMDLDLVTSDKDTPMFRGFFYHQNGGCSNKTVHSDWLYIYIYRNCPKDYTP